MRFIISISCFLLVGCSGLKINTDQYNVAYWSFLNNKQINDFNLQKGDLKIRVKKSLSEVDNEAISSAVKGAVKGLKAGL